MRNHRGFTIIELMIALVVMLVVSAGIFKLMNGTQRLSRAQAERVDLQSNVRTAALYIPNELRELNTIVGGAADRNDIVVAGAGTVRFRAMRGIGFVCQSSGTEIRVNAVTYTGTRAPQAPPRDAAYVFVQGASITADSWLQVVYTALSTANTCPNGNAAYTLTVPAMTAATVGTPVRFYEVVELSVYVTDGKPWLGARSVSAGEVNPQPVLGPLRATAGTQTGLDFKYYDGTGAETAVLANIKSVQVRIWGETTQRIAGSGGGTASSSFVQDSLVTQVSLRNSFRP
ncbi:MAG TPA: prepilin-type N-terminal cleavage/methylation domain-containing protein [Gemmatimonadales bacterium]|nr:prepilin-type N-terminal cleavage/methylation domain-containing protein [Gemmatimonadales bacterium]